MWRVLDTDYCTTFRRATLFGHYIYGEKISNFRLFSTLLMGLALDKPIAEIYNSRLLIMQLR